MNTWILLAAAVYLAMPAGTPARESERPNIIFVLSDDVAQGDLGCYGQEVIQTPHLDRMAEEGTRYLQAYCGTSVCAPSRSSLMTGLHCGHGPVRGNFELAPEGQLPLPAQTVTIADVLKPAGYATACMGKWGMGFFDSSGSPLKQGFDHFFGYNCQRHAHSYFPSYLYRDDQRIPLPGNNGKTVGETYAQDWIQQDVLDWITAHRDQPFFLFYAVTLPHGRHEIDDFGIYADKPWTQTQKAYAAQVTRLDHDMGQMIARLKELDLDQRTLIIFSGDNGSSFKPSSEMGKLFKQANNGLRGFKRGLYEGALRQAAIARWPGVVPAGRVSDEPWAFWDILPTAAELAGAKIPDTLQTDGHSLVSFLKGAAAPERDYFYWELHENTPIQAVRLGYWKAVRQGIEKPIELYDLRTDAGEQHDVAARHPATVAKIAAIMTSAHTPDPNWPLSGKAEHRKVSEQAAWKAYRQP
jgi:arylsulfatase A-like enzyme